MELSRRNNGNQAAGGMPVQEPEIMEESAAAPEPEKTNEPVAAAPDPEPDKYEARLSGIEKGISDLMKSIQANNLKNDSFGGMPETLQEQTDKIMASIIRPEFEKE